MDDLIKKLIEVDRTARKSVENAAGARVAAVRELDEKKQKLREENDREFLEQSEKMKKAALSELEETEKTHEEITAMNNYESTIDQWVELKKELTRLRAEIERTLRGFDTDYIVEERLSQNEVET